MSENNQNNLAGVLLAAGSSSRLGQPKQLVTWNSKTLLDIAIEKLLPICDAGVFVITGAYAEEIESSILHYPLTIIRNQDWRRGMNSSLRCGLEAVLHSNAIASLIMLCDQPLLKREHIESLVKSWNEDISQPAATRYNNSNGVPAILPVSSFKEINKSFGDVGARKYLEKLPNNRLVVVGNSEFDIDTIEDLEKLNEKK
ncbi:MAG: nucleotidyltransferase family protein [Pseudomonadota bacterium]|nr:nucleotidyltransferase family protein [Pseudomonadota bacterium]